MRKRSAGERWGDRIRRRPKTPVPETGWLGKDVAVLTELSPRTITHYVAKGIIDAPEFRGTVTRYQRLQLLRLLAVRPLKADGAGTLRAVSERLNGMGAVELERYLRSKPFTPAVARALGWDQHPEAPPALAASGTAPEGEAWRRIPLLPGLELLMKEDVSPVVRELAARVCAHFVARN